MQIMNGAVNVKNKIFALITIILTLFSFVSCGTKNDKNNINNNSDGNSKSIQKEDLAKPGIEKTNKISNENMNSTSDPKREVRGMWFSYFEMENFFKQKTKAEAEALVKEAFSNVSEIGLTDVFVQVRPFGDAIYKSKYFPSSHFVSGTQGGEMNFDPLSLMVEVAHEKNLKIHAWINPYRIKEQNNPPELSNNNIAKKWLSEKTGQVVEIEKGIYLNPCHDDVKKLIVDGVEEIVKNYKVDGIHFDDYFYPTIDESFDKELYDKYNGNLSHEEWRLAQVNEMVKNVYSKVKEVNKDVVFGVSVVSSIERNKTEHFADVTTWTSEKGYIDYILPQIYHGYKNKAMPFESTVHDWENVMKEDSIALYIGIAPYKIGYGDKWAGDEGADEWIKSTDTVARQIKTTLDSDGCSGYVLYRYDSLFNPDKEVEEQVKKELENIKKK